jgi:hypothetical protein
LPIFDPKNVTTFYHPPYFPDLSMPDYFLFPKLKMKLKGLYFAKVAEIQEAVTDELKKVQKKRNFWQLFRNCTTVQKPVYLPIELILNKKQRHVPSIFKNSVLNFWTALCVLHIYKILNSTSDLLWCHVQHQCINTD